MLQVATLFGLIALSAFGALVFFTAHTARRVDATLFLIHGPGGSTRTFTHSVLERLSGEFRGSIAGMTSRL